MNTKNQDAAAAQAKAQRRPAFPVRKIGAKKPPVEINVTILPAHPPAIKISAELVPLPLGAAKLAARAAPSTTSSVPRAPDETALTAEEGATLVECEDAIERGFKSCLEMATALMLIRDRRLYRAGYPTFEDYCQDRWDFTRQRAHQLIQAAKTANRLAAVVQTPAPTNERQLRILAQVPDDQLPEVCKLACEKSGKKNPSAAHLKEAARAIKEQGEKKPPGGENLKPSSNDGSSGPPSLAVEPASWLTLKRSIAAVIAAWPRQDRPNLKAKLQGLVDEQLSAAGA